QGHVGGQPQLSDAARPHRTVWPVERPYWHDRSPDPQHQGLAVPDASEPQRLHRHARGAAAARRRTVRLDPRGQAEAAHGVRVPAQGRRRSAPRAGGPQDDRQGAAHSVNVAQLLERAALYHAERTALMAGDRRWTYREIATAVRALDLDRESTAAILYTSATTGRPKGVMLTHANIVSNAYATVHHLKMTAEDRGLCALPMFHCFGQNAIMNSLVTAGGTMIMHERFVPDACVDAIATHRITIFYAVPTMYILFLAMERPLDFASVRLYFSAAATLPTDVERRWHARFGHWIQQGYGLTETSPFASYNHDVAFKPGSVGTPIENV